MADEGERQSAYDGLTWKQKRFVDAYFELGFNATAAAKEAGYSERTAYSIGSENLNKPEVKAAISERMAELAMPAEEVLARLAAIARGDIADIFQVAEEEYEQVVRSDEDDEEGDSEPEVQIITVRRAVIDMPRAIEKGKSFLIESYSDTKTGTRVKMYSAADALKTIGKHHKLFTETVEVTGKDGERLFPLDELVAALREADEFDRGSDSEAAD